MSRKTIYYKTGQLYPVQDIVSHPTQEVESRMNGLEMETSIQIPELISPPKPKVVSLNVRYKVLEHANPGSPEVWGDQHFGFHYTMEPHDTQSMHLLYGEEE